MKSEVISVLSTPTIVAGADSSGRGAGPGSVSLPTAALIRVPAGAENVFFGGSAVTTSNGCPIAAGEDLEVDLVNEILYAVVTTGPQSIYVLRRGD